MIHKLDHMRLVHRRTGIAHSLSVLVVAVLITFGLSAGSAGVQAQSLDAARASGMVGERYDGYAVTRGKATPAVRNLVSRVNNQRRKIYAQRAREQKISPAQVGQVFANQIAAKAPKGTWLLSASGSWRRK